MPMADSEDTIAEKLGDWLKIHGLEVKGEAVSGSLPEESLSTTGMVLVGGIHWDSQKDEVWLKTPENLKRGHQENKM